MTMMEYKRAPLSFPISRDSIPLHVYLGKDMHYVSEDVVWQVSVEHIIMLLQMIKHKALIVSRILNSHYYYHGGIIRVMYPKVDVKDYSLTDLEELLGEHVARVYMDALSKCYTELPKNRMSKIMGQKAWNFLNKSIDIAQGGDSWGIWWVSCLYYYEETGRFVMCLRKRSQVAGRLMDEYSFDLSDDEYIEELGMSVYDIFVQVCAWLFANGRWTRHLTKAMNERFHKKVGGDTFITGVSVARLSESKGRRKTIHGGRYVPFFTKGHFMVNTALSSSSIFLLLNQVSVSDLMAEIGDASCAWFHGSRWDVVASINQDKVILGITKNRPTRRGVEEYIYIPAKKYLSDRFIIMPQLKNLYCRIDRWQDSKVSLWIEYERGDDNDKVKIIEGMHSLDVGTFSTIAPHVWSTIKDKFACL